MTHYSKFPQEKLDATLDMNLEDFGFSASIAGVFSSADIYNVRGLLYKTDNELLQIFGVNKLTLKRVKSFLRTKGFY